MAHLDVVLEAVGFAVSDPKALVRGAAAAGCEQHSLLRQLKTVQMCISQPLTQLSSS